MPTLRGQVRKFRPLRGAALAAALLLTACAPQVIPVPERDATGTPPATETPIPLNAPVVEAPSLVALRMFDEQSGWGVSEKQILRTINGGVTWHDVSPAPSDYGYTVTTEFLDVTHAWVLMPDPNDLLSGVLYRTGDGGLHWDQAPVPFGGGALQFVDGRHGWMMASLGAGAGSMGIAIFQTEDGGATWARTYVNDSTQAGAGSSLPLGGLKDGITPINMREAWVGGVIYQPGRIYLYKTSDGGKTWAEIQVTAPEGYQEAELETTGPVFTETRTAYLPVHAASQVGVMLALYVSGDGGASWKVMPQFIPQGGSIDFVSSQVGFVWNGTDLYVTHDGAQTWSTTRPDVDFTDSFAGMDFVSDQVGFILSDEGDRGKHVYVTRDAGATWNIVGY